VKAMRLDAAISNRKNGALVVKNNTLQAAGLALAFLSACGSVAPSQPISAADGGVAKDAELEFDSGPLDSGPAPFMRCAADGLAAEMIQGVLQVRTRTVLGDPIAGATVRLNEGRTPRLSGPTFDDGCVRFEDPRLVPDALWIEVEAEGFAPYARIGDPFAEQVASLSFPSADRYSETEPAWMDVGVSRGAPGTHTVGFGLGRWFSTAGREWRPLGPRESEADVVHGTGSMRYRVRPAESVGLTVVRVDAAGLTEGLQFTSGETLAPGEERHYRVGDDMIATPNHGTTDRAPDVEWSPGMTATPMLELEDARFVSLYPIEGGFRNYRYPDLDSVGGSLAFSLHRSFGYLLVRTGTVADVVFTQAHFDQIPPKLSMRFDGEGFHIQPARSAADAMQCRLRILEPGGATTVAVIEDFSGAEDLPVPSTAYPDPGDDRQREVAGFCFRHRGWTRADGPERSPFLEGVRNYGDRLPIIGD